MEEGAQTYLFRNIPEKLYSETRQLAKKRGLTLRTQLLLLMEEFVNASKNEIVKKYRDGNSGGTQEEEGIVVTGQVSGKESSGNSDKMGEKSS